MERKKVENRIRELREMHNYTREGMAEMVEISPKFKYCRNCFFQVQIT